MEKSAKTPVGVIGLGIIGSRVAALLRREGHAVSVWNRSPKPEPSFLASATEVAEAADILQLFVRDGAALLDVLKTVGPALGPSHLVMNHATVGPAETLEAERLVKERGAAFLDAPFTVDLGIHLDGASPGECTTFMLIQPRHLQQDGYVHAGVQATIADHTAGTMFAGETGGVIAGG